MTKRHDRTTKHPSPIDLAAAERLEAFTHRLQRASVELGKAIHNRALRLLTGPDPQEINEGQREALEEPLSRMDSAALVRDFISLDGFETNHGPLPDDLRSAWKALESAVAVFDELLVINEVGR